MAGDAGRGGRCWAIAVAFAGQAVLLISTGALVNALITTPLATTSGAAPLPASASLLPVVSSANVLPYALSIDGQTSRGALSLSTQPLPTPSYMVKPGQDLVVRLVVTLPATMHLWDLTLGLDEDINATVETQFKIVFHDHAHPLGPGQHTFTEQWTGSGSELRPGTKWGLFMAPEGSLTLAAPVATITVAP
jgi:hypothetical protein